MSGRYSPITKTILLGDENVSIEYLKKIISELFADTKEEKISKIGRSKYKSQINKLKKNIEQLLLKSDNNKDSYKDINKLIDKYEKIKRLYFALFSWMHYRRVGIGATSIPKAIQEIKKDSDLDNIVKEYNKRNDDNNNNNNNNNNNDIYKFLDDNIINLLDSNNVINGIKRPGQDIFGEDSHWLN